MDLEFLHRKSLLKKRKTFSVSGIGSKDVSHFHEIYRCPSREANTGYVHCTKYHRNVKLLT